MVSIEKPDEFNRVVDLEGHYRLDVFAHLLGDRKPTRLLTQELSISHEAAASLEEPGTGLYFDWGPDSARYLPHVDKRPPLPDPEEFIGLLSLRPPPVQAAREPGKQSGA